MNLAVSLLNLPVSSWEQTFPSIQNVNEIHLDFMDGTFVSEKSFAISDLQDLPFPCDLSVHLMVDDPERFFDDFYALGCRSVFFHIENTGEKKAIQLLKKLQEKGVFAGIVLDFPSSVDLLTESVLLQSDAILLMSVKCGKGGQDFQSAVLDKIKYLREKWFAGEIIVDGGVGIEEAKLLAQAGAGTIVVGSAILKLQENDRIKMIEAFQKI